MTYAVSSAKELGKTAIVQDFGIGSVPHLVIINSKNKLCKQYSGYNSQNNEMQIKNDLDELLGYQHNHLPKPVITGADTKR